ncbi:MAG: TatD family hydrolase [Clostridia bacterium]|nr:TatD family hydrolase [Clostridia bacterium]
MIDTHAHYCDERFEADRDGLLSGLHENENVYAIIEAGCDIPGSVRVCELAEKHPFVYAAAGIQPQEVAGFRESDLDELCKLLSRPKVVAVGEIGLDYHYTTEDKELQKRVFRAQLEIAQQLKMPVVIHERDSIADCLECVFDYDVCGTFHAFSGSRETAKKLLDRGWYISFGGTVTFKNARVPVENAAYVPDDRILTETDCPYLTPHPFRGKRNDSGYMRFTIQKLAEIRGVEYEYIEHITERNAKELFGIA